MSRVKFSHFFCPTLYIPQFKTIFAMTDSTPISALVDHHEKYWNRDPSSWGSLNDWDIYFIENVNGCTKHDAHRSLSLELGVLLKNFHLIVVVIPRQLP
ncbi:hypothetical protein RclHR1_21870004 [Rhizophagus clarus]|uniref:Uncharacterized protein n=1 Tax=Rhizophagus clarus TaxID=94130 RepID=A0A2Z6QTZ9_9GLOM|nr:hypothetical protein RclHR1_21870004 [Rhizophagus clarus]